MNLSNIGNVMYVCNKIRNQLPNMEFPNELLIGYRLRNLADQLAKQSKEIYDSQGLDFDSKWFPVFYPVVEEGQFTIMQLASLSGLTHPGVIKLVREMEQDGWLESVKDERDKRKRWIRATESAQEKLPQLRAAWDQIKEAHRGLNQEATQNFLLAVREMEQALQKKSLVNRLRIAQKETIEALVDILDYEDDYLRDFQRLNLDWLQEFFTVEPEDRALLENPNYYLLKDRGKILMARLNMLSVGTVAIKNHGEGNFELTHLCVEKSHRGKHIGKSLAKAAIQRSRNLMGRRLFLESNSSLVVANRLFQKLGFREVKRTQQQGRYQRSNVFMEMYL